jgi:OOP family OmpA-OmpF porin
MFIRENKAVYIDKLKSFLYAELNVLTNIGVFGCSLTAKTRSNYGERSMFKRSTFAILAITAAGAATAADGAGAGGSAGSGAGGSAMAADIGFYGVASVGRSSIDVDSGSINAFGAQNVGPTVTSSSSNDVGWKLQLGYQMTPTWALEGGYTSLGEADYITSNPTYTARGTRKANLINLDLVGRMQINPSFSFLGRIGGYYWRTEADLPFAAGLSRVTDTGTDFKIGAGLQYDFTRNFALRGEFERFNGIGKSSTAGDSKVNLFSIGAVLKFQ